MMSALQGALHTRTCLDMIGETPLLKLGRIGSLPDGVSVLAKAEHLNPSGSVKDRAVRAMILQGLDSQELTLGKTIVDATSGNTGIALSMIGAELGFPVKLFLPADTGLERKSIMRSFGAKLVETDPLSGPDGAYLAARQSVAADPERYFYPDQFNNHANAFAHFVGTGREIWEQTGGQVTHFLASAGTSGTFTGASKRLKSENPAIRTLLVQPATPIHGIEGTKHLETSIKPGILDESLVDGSISVTTQEAYETTRKLARRSGLYVGVSSGANVAAAMKLARQSPPGSVIVTILSDSGARYLSYPLWQV